MKRNRDCRSDMKLAAEHTFVLLEGRQADRHVLPNGSIRRLKSRAVKGATRAGKDA